MNNIGCLTKPPKMKLTKLKQKEGVQKTDALFFIHNQ